MVLMEDLDHQRKSLINFTKTNIKFCSSLHYNADNSHLFVNGKEISTFIADNKIINFVSDVFLMGLVLLSLEKYL